MKGFLLSMVVVKSSFGARELIWQQTYRECREFALWIRPETMSVGVTGMTFHENLTTPSPSALVFQTK